MEMRELAEGDLPSLLDLCQRTLPLDPFSLPALRHQDGIGARGNRFARGSAHEIRGLTEMRDVHHLGPAAADRFTEGGLDFAAVILGGGSAIVSGGTDVGATINGAAAISHSSQVIVRPKAFSMNPIATMF